MWFGVRILEEEEKKENKREKSHCPGTALRAGSELIVREPLTSCVNNPQGDVIADKSCVPLRVIFKLAAPFRKDVYMLRPKLELAY